MLFLSVSFNATADLLCSWLVSPVAAEAAVADDTDIGLPPLPPPRRGLSLRRGSLGDGTRGGGWATFALLLLPLLPLLSFAAFVSLSSTPLRFTLLLWPPWTLFFGVALDGEGVCCCCCCWSLWFRW